MVVYSGDFTLVHCTQMTGMNRVAFRKQIPISISDVGGEAAHWKRGGCAGAQRI